MTTTAALVELEAILHWREMYRLEMDCQIIHDSIHVRAGWTREYAVYVGSDAVGYGSVAVGGPWTGHPTVYEFHVVPLHRLRLFDLFHALLEASGAVAIEVQSNDVLATVMLHAFAPQVTSESILFQDQLTTAFRPAGAVFREPLPGECPDVSASQLPWHGVVEVEGRVAGRGGILFHYNRPYGDIYMDVEASFRRRGVGSYLVQELKRVAREGGHIPAARCNPANEASRRTLQRSGFVPCGHILTGAVGHVRR